MAGFKKVYVSQNEFLEDVAKSTGLFDEEYYELAKEAGKGAEYLSIMVGTKDKIVSSFDRTVYNKLSGADRFNYYVTENLLDKKSEDYKTNKQYFDQKIKEIQNKEIFDSLSGFEKTMNTIGGFVGNAFLQVGGIVEGLLDAAALVTGGKDIVAKDITGYGAAQEAMNDWINKYTFIDKNTVLQVANDVSTGIVRMTPMIAGTLLAPYTAGVSAKIGTSVYYASMAGNTAEEVIKNNPDIDYGSLLLYTAGSVGLEALTEWASGKLFGDDIVSAMMKGQKYAPTGSIIKNIAKNFGTEALEEATSELFGSILYRTIIDEDAPIASIQDILYAALIGGLTGAVMSGGQVLTTKRKSVIDGKLVDTKKLTKQQRKTARNLGIRESYGLNNLLTVTQQSLSEASAVTKLMTKYGTSLSELIDKHSNEYETALASDKKTQTQQAKAILDLSNLLQTIGVEQFKKSADLLNNNLEFAKISLDNYLNHTDTYNEAASLAYSIAFDGQTMTPSVPNNAEQTLIKALRELYPNLKVVFGVFGQEDGLSVKSIAGTKGWLFIESGLVDKLGYDALLKHTIRNELAKSTQEFMSTLPTDQLDPLVNLLTDENLKYKDLSNEQKHTIAQMICFDPVHNRKVFLSQKECHKKLFRYITDQVKYVKTFARRTDANKVRFSDLLKIRNTFIDSITDTINSTEDIAYSQDEYALSDEEVKSKIIDKTTPTTLNKFTILTNFNFSKNTIQMYDAINELITNRIDTTVDFDYSRIYDKDYYTPEWVTSVLKQQQSTDFESALKTHLSVVYKINLDNREQVVVAIKNILTPKEIEKLSQLLLSKDFLDTNPTPEVLQTEISNILYTFATAIADTGADSIVITDNQIKGTGKLRFFKGDIYAEYDVRGKDQRGDASVDTSRQIRRVVSEERKYQPREYDGIRIAEQSTEYLDDYQKNLIDITKKEYGVDLVFYKGNVYNIEKNEYANILGFYLRGDNKIFVRDDSLYKLKDVIDSIRHEVIHHLIYKTENQTFYNELTSKLENIDDGDFMKKQRSLTKERYPETTSDVLQEEAVVDIITKAERKGDISPQYEAVNKAANEFYNDIIKNKDKWLFIEALHATSDTAIETQIKQKGKIVKNLLEQKKRFLKDTKNIIKSTSKATTPKQIADAITSIVANSPMAYSESKGFEGAEMEYTKVAQSMIDENFGLFRKVNQGNYQQIRDNIAKTDAPYTQQALVIFDRALFTYAEDSSRFDEATQEKIKNQARQTQTISAQWQGLQSRRLADKTSLTEIKNKFAEDGYDISVSNETVTNYVPEMKNKEKFIKQIDEDIAKIESQIDDAKDSVEKAALNKELKDATEKRMVMDKGTNEEIMDWVITNEDIVNRASKIQKEIFEQMVDKAEKAAETPGKKAITILVDEKTGLPKPFPKATQWIEKNVKRLKSFRMWAMLASPVSWVRNWVGNAGMTALDGVTNQLEKWMTARLPQIDVAKLEQQAKELNSKKTLTDAEKTKLAEINAQIQQAYDFKFVETTASKELKQQIAKEYESVFQQILNGEDISKYEGSAEKAGAIARAEREITRKSENANFVQKVWAACQSMTDWGLNTGWFGDNAVVLNSLVKNFANMVESNKAYLIKSLTTEYGKDGRGMSAERKALVEKALNTKNSMDIVNAMSKSDVELFMDSCKQRTFEQYFKNSNWLSNWASNLSQKHPILASLTSLVLPFPKVAANIMTMAYKYSPLGFISALKQWSVVKQMDAAGYEGVRDAFARAKLTRTTAQATVGTVMCIAGLLLASLGFIDIDDDDYLGPALHIGDLRISLSNLAPSMTTFSVGAAMMWAWKNDQSAALKALDVLYDNTLLGNIENVFRYGDPTKYIENLSINYVSQYVPAMLKLFAKFTTNQAMIDKSGSYFEKLGKTFVSGIPFAADLLPKKINPYTGEFLTNTGSQDVFFNFMEAISPLDFKTTTKSKTQKEAERLGTESSGLTGKFKVNDTEYDIDKVTYSKYRATYIQNTFDNIMNGEQEVTVEDENGKRITTTYDKLTDKQKKNVLSRLYTEATNITKIKWWTDQGNKYVVTDRDLYNEYRKQFKNIVYKKTWTKSKFVES